MQKIQGWSPIGDARQTKQNKNKFAKLNFITVTHDSDLEENVWSDFYQLKWDVLK